MSLGCINGRRRLSDVVIADFKLGLVVNASDSRACYAKEREESAMARTSVAIVGSLERNRVEL